jgi:hypothetical protein
MKKHPPIKHTKESEIEYLKSILLAAAPGAPIIALPAIGFHYNNIPLIVYDLVIISLTAWVMIAFIKLRIKSPVPKKKRHIELWGLVLTYILGILSIFLTKVEYKDGHVVSATMNILSFLLFLLYFAFAAYSGTNTKKYVLIEIEPEAPTISEE